MALLSTPNPLSLHTRPHLVLFLTAVSQLADGGLVLGVFESHLHQLVLQTAHQLLLLLQQLRLQRQLLQRVLVRALTAGERRNVNKQGEVDGCYRCSDGFISFTVEVVLNKVTSSLSVYLKTRHNFNQNFNCSIF